MHGYRTHNLFSCAFIWFFACRSEIQVVVEDRIPVWQQKQRWRVNGDFGTNVDSGLHHNLDSKLFF
jgi:hypothetical protein